MKTSKNIIMLLAFLSIGLFGSSVYATDVTIKASNITTTSSNVTTTSSNVMTTSSNVKVETITKNDKKVEVITSEDQYVRITQPTKVNTSTFESKMNVMGEVSQGTDITIEVYTTSQDKNNSYLLKNVILYDLKTVGFTETFSQLIELLEGENKIVLTYTNIKDKKNKEKMIFYVTRESEEKKELIKNYNVFQDSKSILK